MTEAKTTDVRTRAAALKRWPKGEAYRTYWLDRVRAKCVVDENGCWVWQGSLHTNGYGQTSWQGRTGILSRFMYKVWHRVELQKRQYVCHSCDVKRCCNPDHLWLGDNGLNKKDETLKGKNFFAKKTHCPRGHEYNSENTHVHEVRPGVWSRGCKACSRVHQRLKLGWTLEEAMKTPVIPAGQPTARRYRSAV